MKTTYISIGIIILLLIAAGAYAFFHIEGLKHMAVPATGNVVQYSCTQGTIAATFTEGQVALVLSDGRQFMLPQAPSGSGIRYEKDGVVLVGKGNDAFLTENGTTTYANCVAAASNTGGMSGDTNAGMKTFTDASKTFRFSYPTMFSVTGGGIGYTNGWSDGSTETGLVLAQVVIPGSFQPKTNLSEARFSVGTSAAAGAVKNCFVNTNGNVNGKTEVTINGTKYTKLTYGDAGAGNFYDTTSYRTVRNDQCYAIEYTIHSTNVGNYSPDQGITEFDKAKVQSLLEGMAQSFAFL